MKNLFRISLLAVFFSYPVLVQGQSKTNKTSVDKKEIQSKENSNPAVAANRTSGTKELRTAEILEPSDEIIMTEPIEPKHSAAVLKLFSENNKPKKSSIKTPALITIPPPDN